MEGQGSLRKQAKFSQRILCSRRRILRSPMPNEHPDLCGGWGISVKEQNSKAG